MTRRRVDRRTLALAVALAVCAAVPACRPPPPEITPTTSITTPRADSGWPTVGVLFSTDAGIGEHYCSASAIHSARRDLVLTAAHCIPDPDDVTGLEFAPGYHDDETPYGLWSVLRAVVDERWTEDADPDSDVAVLVVAAHDGREIEDVTGANLLGTAPAAAADVRVVGYPSGSDQPVTCSGSASADAPVGLQVDCPGLTAGTSGSPWLIDIDRETGEGTVIGVVGGWEDGGATADRSYTSTFDADVDELLERAE